MRPLRSNVLLLMAFGYASCLAGFFALWHGGLSPADAWGTIKDPLMALVGGSIALAKDLLQLDADEEGRS